MDSEAKQEPFSEPDILLSSVTKSSSKPVSPASIKPNKGKRHLPDPFSEIGNGKWSDDEHKRFLQALELYGNCWKKVEEYVGTRTCAQIRSHCQKYFRRLRNKTLQELKRTNQLQGKVFIVTKEYYNYSGCANQPMEPELKTSARLPTEQGSTKSEDQKEPVHFGLASSPYQELEQKPQFEIFDELKSGEEVEEGMFGAPFSFCDENVFLTSGNEIAFKEEYEDYGAPYLARVAYEA